ncbi:hypothetical protein AVEN_166695-1 [Araneus ventricosus]|uniref:Uncharacterized protein n=1 Tax=Araneus ventricosus TaxID=182803 RepID=A0A4Y2KFR9_ARAVE|nr:hypothetical protein AVEN_166695-1 [Araneus ventricosus]
MYEEVYSKWENRILTDGSRQNERMGCGFAHYQDGFQIDFKVFKLSDASLVFMAEMTSIRETVEYVIESGLGPTQIISDSRSSLMALASTYEKRSFINEIKRKIKFHKHKIGLCWMKALKAYTGNKRADLSLPLYPCRS